MPVSRPYNVGVIGIRHQKNAVLLPVKVVPGASRTRCLGELDGRAKIAVASPAEGGRANKALLAFLARQIGISRTAITIETGLASPVKTVRIEQASAEQVLRGLGLDEP